MFSDIFNTLSITFIDMYFSMKVTRQQRYDMLCNVSNGNEDTC